MRYRNTGTIAELTAVICVMALALGGCSAGHRHKSNGNETTGATLGGSLGTMRDQSAGTDLIASYMSEQADALGGIEGPSTERSGDEIKVTWPGTELFDLDSAMLTKASRNAMARMAEIFVQYPDTYILITGHTDSEGDDGYNQKLSERRALSVRTYLEENGVASGRLETIGYGALRPIASNDTDEGRARNQRVEIIVRASDDLRRRAQDG